MFFTAPQQSASENSRTLTLEPACKESAPKRKRRITEEHSDNVEQVHSYYPKRISRACDRCRLKKTRCSGGKICSRCKNDGVVCVTTSNPKKEESGRSSEYVHLVESQRDRLVQALQKVLEDSNSTDQARVRALLTDMGFSTNHLQKSPTAEPDVTASGINEYEPQAWDNMFESLDTLQLEAIESLWRADNLSGQRIDHMSDEPSQSSTQPLTDSTFDLVQDQPQINVNTHSLDNEAEPWLYDPLPYDPTESPAAIFTTTSARQIDQVDS